MILKEILRVLKPDVDRGLCRAGLQDWIKMQMPLSIPFLMSVLRTALFCILKNSFILLITD